MDVFKYKQLQSGNQSERKRQMTYILDIIENRRLFCASYQDLNDPMEGYFDAVAKNRSEFRTLDRMVDEILQQQSKYRICSLSTNEKSHLMWAHYANGFRGVAIKFDIKKKVNLIEEVEYSDGRNLADYDPGGDLDDLTRKVLLTKYKEWKYEKEIRIIRKAEGDGPCYFDLPEPPIAVYFGINIDPLDRIKLIQACSQQGIATYDMHLSSYKIFYRSNRETYKAERLPLDG